MITIQMPPKRTALAILAAPGAWRLRDGDTVDDECILHADGTREALYDRVGCLVVPLALLRDPRAAERYRWSRATVLSPFAEHRWDAAVEALHACGGHAVGQDRRGRWWNVDEHDGKVRMDRLWEAAAPLHSTEAAQLVRAWDLLGLRNIAQRALDSIVTDAVNRSIAGWKRKGIARVELNGRDYLFSVEPRADGVLHGSMYMFPWPGETDGPFYTQVDDRRRRSKRGLRL